jgi:hypothetical protein
MGLNNFIYTKQTEGQIENLPNFMKKALFSSKEPAPVKIQIKALEEKIASTDYQIIKCYEYSLAGLELPYDIQELHNSREAIRKQIRELEEQM